MLVLDVHKSTKNIDFVRKTTAATHTAFDIYLAGQALF